MCRILVLLVLVSLAVAPAAFGLGSNNASLGDYVWFDADADGIQDGTEVGIPGVLVTATRYGTDGSIAYRMTKTTDANGLYLFQYLAAGTYIVTTNVAGLDPTKDLDDDLPTIDTPNEAVASLAAGQMRDDVDFGYVSGSIGDYVWLDADRDTEQDADEAGIAGVTVNLLDAAGAVLATTTTDANGLYTFGGLVAGDYSVQVDYSTISPADLELSYDLDGIGTANIAGASLALGENRTDLDFGYKPPVPLGSIGDYVWFDADGDAQQDATELGIPNVTVELYQGTSLLQTATTDGAGLYLFGGLQEGSYTVKVVASTLPAGLVQTYDLDGLGTANVATASLAAGEDRRDVDFGYTTDTPDDRPYQTQTQGGWGNKPKDGGGNPGSMLHDNFMALYPNGLEIGSNHTLTFTCAQAITDFLPQGGTAGTLWLKSYTNPVKKTEAGVFAGQVLALRLNVDFSDAGVIRTGLGSLIIQRGAFEGSSVYDLLEWCEKVLGGMSSDCPYSITELNEAATAVNENYVDGTTDKGYLAAE